jgi:hypothetical protein
MITNNRQTTVVNTFCHQPHESKMSRRNAINMMSQLENTTQKSSTKMKRRGGIYQPQIPTQKHFMLINDQRLEKIEEGRLRRVERVKRKSGGSSSSKEMLLEGRQ